MRSYQKQHGFTAIELIFVITIIGIAVSMAVPRFGNWMASQDLDAAARELAADIRLLQQMTINAGDNPTPIMNFKISAPYGYYTSPSLDGTKPARDFPTTIRLSATPATFTFSRNGTPTTPKTITLSRTDGGGSRAVIIDSVGRVRIQ